MLRNLKNMSNQKGVKEIKSAEEVMKWQVDDSIKVMLIQNIVNGNLKFEDPKLVEYLKNLQSQTFQNSQPSQSTFYEAKDVVTNMVMFNGHLCFTIKDSPNIFVNNMKGDTDVSFATYNVKHLVAKNGYLYFTDIENRVIVLKFNNDFGRLEYVNHLSSRDKEITSIFASDDKIYLGFLDGSVQVYNSNTFSSYGSHSPIDLPIADNKPILHIIKFGNWMVYATEKDYYMHSPSKIKNDTTVGTIVSLKIVNNTLYILTKYGVLKFDDAGNNIHELSFGGFYHSDSTKTNVLIHNDEKKLFIALEDGQVANRKGDIIVNHSPGSNVVMLIHENKLYSSGADKLIKVTPL